MRVSRNLPVDGCLAVGGQISVCLGKGPATEKAVVGGQGRGVGGFEDEMLGEVDEGAFSLGVITPKDEN